MLFCSLWLTRRLIKTTSTPPVIDPKARYWWKIAIFAPLRGPRRNTAITIRFGVKKTRIMWLPDSEEVTDSRTDTARRHRAR